MKSIIIPILAGLWLAFAPAVTAAVATVIPYHGRVAVAGAPFTGTGQFRFALTNEDGSQIHWKNSATDHPVAVHVIAGEFEVAVGNAAIFHMADIPFAVFDNSPLYLRVWFDDGIHGELEMLPATRLLAVPFAIMAKSVEDGAITEQKIADGAVQSGKIGLGAVGTAQIFPGAVQDYHLGNEIVKPDNIAPAAVGTAALADGSVTTAKIADNAITNAKLADLAVTTAKLDHFAVGTGQIQNNAINSAKIANGEVLASHIGSGAVGTFHLADASVTAAKLAPGAANASLNGGSLQLNALQVNQLQAGVVNAGTLEAEVCTAGAFQFAPPRTYAHFLHGGEFFSHNLKQEAPGVKRMEPFTLRADHSDAEFFRAPLRLPEGARIRKVSVVLDVLDDTSINFGYADAAPSFAVRVLAMPITLNQVSVPINRLVDFPLPLVERIKGSFSYNSLDLTSPNSHLIGPAAFTFGGHIYRYDSPPLEEVGAIMNAEQIYVCEIEWTGRFNESTDGNSGSLGRGIYGIRIEYELEELQP